MHGNRGQGIWESRDLALAWPTIKSSTNTNNNNRKDHIHNLRATCHLRATCQHNHNQNQYQMKIADFYVIYVLRDKMIQESSRFSTCFVARSAKTLNENTVLYESCAKREARSYVTLAEPLGNVIGRFRSHEITLLT